MIAARRAKALAIRAASGAKRCMRDFPLNGLSTRFDLPGSGETIYCGAPLQKRHLDFIAHGATGVDPVQLPVVCVATSGAFLQHE